jgi:hypothetical protein
MVARRWPILRLATASVWIVFGLVFKVLQVVPRHETIVATVLGQTYARPVTLAIGCAETLMGLWILSQRWPRSCAATQTIAIIGMNALELSLAREHLLAPWPMVAANTVFLALGWYLALHTPPPKPV